MPLLFINLAHASTLRAKRGGVLVRLIQYHWWGGGAGGGAQGSLPRPRKAGWRRPCVKRIRRCWTFHSRGQARHRVRLRVCEVVLGTHVQCSETQPGGSLEQECGFRSRQDGPLCMEAIGKLKGHNHLGGEQRKHCPHETRRRLKRAGRARRRCAQRNETDREKERVQSHAPLRAGQTSRRRRPLVFFEDKFDQPVQICADCDKPRIPSESSRVMRFTPAAVRLLIALLLSANASSEHTSNDLPFLLSSLSACIGISRGVRGRHDALETDETKRLRGAYAVT